jgi:hypothetical protein
MRITDAYIVIIDFDGDIASEVIGIHVFTTLKETMDIVRQALTDMNNHYKAKHKIPLLCYIDGYEISIDKVISSDIYLRDFIDYGDGCFGNWEITVLETEE